MLTQDELVIIYKHQIMSLMARFFTLHTEGVQGLRSQINTANFGSKADTACANRILDILLMYDEGLFE